jgi:hypothetical protein
MSFCEYIYTRNFYIESLLVGVLLVKNCLVLGNIMIALY